MINREQVEKCLAVMDALPDDDVELSINSKIIELKVYPKNWYYAEKPWTDEKRHEVLGIVTPLVGKLDKVVDGGNIGYKGEKDGLSIRMNYVDKCKIVGYKTVTKTVRKEVEKEPEYVTEEVEQRIAITDCDIRTGKFSQDDIEVSV